MPPPKKLTSRGKPGKKVAKVEPIVYGPADFHSGQSWVAVQTQLAELVDSSAVLLAAQTMEWRWQKLANSVWAPLRNASGYASLLKKLQEAKGARYIIIKMDAPRIPLPTASAPAPVVS
jgi:hypothetical protein